MKIHFPHEKKAIEEIKKALENNKEIVLFPQINIIDESCDGLLEIDLIAVSKWIIFLTELKHWNGKITIGGESWVRSGEEEESPHIY